MGDWDDKLDPQLKPLLWMIPNWDWGPWRRNTFVWLQRFMPAMPRGPGVDLEVEHHNGQEFRLFRPEGGLRRRVALLWFHGGGRILGQPGQDDATCARMARRLGLLVVASSYRLAPDDPFPAALDDCVTAWQWLAGQAEELGVDTLLIGGESAGGGLAAELAQRLMDEGGPQPAAQLLVYPMLDDRTALDPHKTAQQHLVWSNTSNHYAWSAYLGEHFGADDAPPYAAASRRADLAGVPPAWLMVGEHDLFYEEIVLYTQRLKACGVDAELLRVPGGFHGMFAVGQQQPAIRGIWDSLEQFVLERV